MKPVEVPNVVTNASPEVKPAMAIFLAVACAVSVANVYYAQPLLDGIGHTLHIAPSELGLVTTVTQAGVLAGLVLIVPLGDLVNRRRLIVTLSVIAAVALVLVALSTTALVFFVASGIVGLVTGVVQLITAYAAGLSAPEARGRVVGIVTSGVVIGILLARTASGLLADAYGWRSVYVLSAALMAVLALVLVRVLPDDRVARTRLSYGALITSVVTLTIGERLFRTRSLIALFMFGGFGAVWGSMALPLADAPWHLSSGQIGLFGIVGAVGALGAARAGRLADRGLAQWVSGATLVLYTASWALIAYTPQSLVLLTAGVVILDFAGQALHVTNQHLIVDLDPDAASRLLGSYMVYYSLGTGAGAIAATSLYSAVGWGAVSVLGAGLSVLALTVWAADRLRHRQRGLDSTWAVLPLSAPEIGSPASPLSECC
ncbi:MAG: MFS transporter [Mycobacterium sp.]